MAGKAFLKGRLVGGVICCKNFSHGFCEKISRSSFFVVRWITNLDIECKTPNLKITPPNSRHFTGQDIDIVETRPNFMKMTLQAMGILNVEDQDKVIEKIKMLIKKQPNVIEESQKKTDKDVWE